MMHRQLKELKINADSILAVLFIVSAFVPYLSYVGRGDVLTYMMFAAWFTVIVIRRGVPHRLLGVLRKRSAELTYLLLFMVVALLNYLFVTPTTKAFQFTVMPITYCLAIIIDSYYFIRPPAYKLTIFFVISIILGIQAGVSIPFVFGADETISRMYTSGELEGAELENAVKHGIGSANMYANLAGFFFLGLGAIPRYKNRMIKTIIYICLALILLSLISSSYSVAFWLLALGSLVLILKANWRKLKFVHVFILGTAIAGLLTFYSLFLVNSTVYEPIERKLNLIKEGNLRDDGRIDLAALSINTFLDHPLLGIGVPEWGREKEVGEHAPWFDFPAHYGIIGFLPFVLFVVVLLRKNYRFYFRPIRKNLYSTVCLIGVLVYIVSNFIDPTLFETPMIIMMVFFYTSINNWGIAKFSAPVMLNEKHLIYK